MQPNISFERFLLAKLDIENDKLILGLLGAAEHEGNKTSLITIIKLKYLKSSQYLAKYCAGI